MPIERRSRGEAGCRHSIIGTVGFWGGWAFGGGVVVGEGAVDAVICSADDVLGYLFGDLFLLIVFQSFRSSLNIDNKWIGAGKIECIINIHAK